jgi:protein gp37
VSGRSEIEWSDKVWNPTRGCTRISAGCENCYAERFALRLEGLGLYHGIARPGPGGARWTGRVELVPGKLGEPLRWRVPRRIFVNSMSDLFHESLSDEDIAAVFGVMAAAPQHTFQLLTKRAERMRRWFEWVVSASLIHPRLVIGAHAGNLISGVDIPGGGWPLPNVHLGVSVENQATADERIPLLRGTPAAVRFVSYEPALEGVDFAKHVESYAVCRGGCVGERTRTLIDEEGCCASCGEDAELHYGIDWLIVGGESGFNARPFDLAWARAAIAQCRAARVPVFVKQLGARPFDADLFRSFPTFTTWANKAQGWLAGRRGQIVCVDQRRRICSSGAEMQRARDEGAFPVDVFEQLELRDPKGGDPAEWPEDLRVREFPRASTPTPGDQHGNDHANAAGEAHRG